MKSVRLWFVKKLLKKIFNNPLDYASVELFIEERL